MNIPQSVGPKATSLNLLLLQHENLISTHSKDFCEKIGPNSPDFWKYMFESSDSFNRFPAGSQNMKGLWKLSAFIAEE